MSGLPSWARVGAKVVCIDAALPPGRRLQLVAGAEYVLAGAFEARGGVWAYIAGTTNRSGGIGRWRLSRFRPLVTLEDDLKAHFSHHIDAPVRVSEEA